MEGNWTNNGTITAQAGSTLILGDYWNAAASDPGARSDAWVNRGSLLASNATVELGGWLTDTPSNLDSLSLGTDTVELIGTLDNRNQTLALVPGITSSSGSWILNGGRIDGGTIATTGGAALVAAGNAYYTPPANGTLDGVTLNGTLDMSADGSYVVVVDGLTLNTDLYLSGDNSELQFDDGSAVAAGPLVQNATIHLIGAYSVLYNDTSPNGVLNNDPNQTVTIGSHVTISGESYSSGVFGPFDNLGTIETNTACHLLVFELVNDGSVEAGQGGNVTLDRAGTVSTGSGGFYFFAGQPWSNNADGTITATQGGTLNLQGQWTNNSTIKATQGGTLNLQGQWTNNGTMTATGAATLVVDDTLPWTNDGTITATQDTTVSLGGPWTNDGTITAVGATLNLFGAWTNDGTITADAASTVTLGDPSDLVSGPGDIWKNSGILSIAPGATVNLGGYFTTDEFESGFQSLGVDLNLAQYTVNLVGILDNSAADNPVTGGTLTLNASTGPLFLSSGEINGGTITGTAPVLVNGYSVLQDVVLDAAVNVPAFGGLTLQGNWSITANGRITATGGDLELSGIGTNNGTITATGGEPNVTGTLANNGSVTATGSQLYWSGTWINNGTITAAGSQLSWSGTWTNNGTFTATGSLLDVVGPPSFDDLQANNGAITAFGADLDLGGAWTNNGVITADAASTVTLGDPSYLVSGPSDIWKNAGTLAIAPGATLYLGGYFTTDEFERGFQQLGANLNLSQYTVVLVGIMDNSRADNPITGGTLALTAATGPLDLEGGQINSGVITTSGSNDLVPSYGTLDGVTLDCTMDMSGSIDVMGGLILDTDLYLSGYLEFLDGSAVLVGPLVTSATIYLNGGYIGSDGYEGAVTIGRGITICGEGYGGGGAFVGPFDNLGTIEANGGGTMSFDDGLVNDGSIEASYGGAISIGSSLVNDGPIEASYGGTISIYGLVNNAGGTITATDSSLGLVGAWTNNSTITATDSSLDLGGAWTNNGTITADAASTVTLGDVLYLGLGPFGPGDIWQNSGTLAIAPGATVNLGGYFTTDEFETQLPAARRQSRPGRRHGQPGWHPR